MANVFGRQVVVPLTNKSGGAIIAGDVVVIDSANDEAFTTTTSAASTVGVGVAQEAIASNAVGRVLVGGYAALVNVAASVTRGDYGTTHTVAKQATSTASRSAGTFCRFLKGGTTPSAYVFPTDLLGASLTNPMSAIGDIIQGTTAGAPARLAAPLAGKVLTGAGLTTTLVYSYPPGYEFTRVAKTATTNITATSEGTADTVVTATGTAFDGSTDIDVELFFPWVQVPTGNLSLQLALYDDNGGGAASIGIPVRVTAEGTSNNERVPVWARVRLTPSNATHTYSVRGFVTSGTGIVGAGAGGNGNYSPGYIRLVKA